MLWIWRFSWYWHNGGGRLWRKRASLAGWWVHVVLGARRTTASGRCGAWTYPGVGASAGTRDGRAWVARPRLPMDQALHAPRVYWHMLRCHGVPVPPDAHMQCPPLASCGTRASSLTARARYCSYRTAPFIPPTPCRESILFASFDPLDAIPRGTRLSNHSCEVVGGPNGSFLSKHVHVCEI